jgi:glutathione S-transferase
VGEPYETVLLDYGTTMKSTRLPRGESNGEGAGHPTWRHGGDGGGGDLRLSCRQCSPTAASRRRLETSERGPYYRWLFFAAGPIEAVISNTAMGFSVPLDKEPMMGYGSPERALARSRRL